MSAARLGIVGGAADEAAVLGVGDDAAGAGLGATTAGLTAAGPGAVGGHLAVDGAWASTALGGLLEVGRANRTTVGGLGSDGAVAGLGAAVARLGAGGPHTPGGHLAVDDVEDVGVGL